MKYLALALALVACTKTAVDEDDDGPGVDGSVDPGVGCTPTSPRSVPPETFVGPTGLENRIIGFIDGAQTKLDVAIYLFTVDSIGDAIVRARQRGVAVRVLFDPDHVANGDARSQLTEGDVEHRNAPSIYSFSHAKYMIADDRALIMSANFNVDAMRSERNYGLIDRDPDDLADLQAIFDMDWASGGGESAQPADLACTRLIVSPTNAKDRIVALIDGAQETLEVEAIYVSELTVRDAIGAAKQRGVNVRVILEGGSDNLETKQLFVAQGIAVHDADGFFNHAKLIIADGIAFVGSENFSLTALTRNREIGALVFEPQAAAVIRTQFDADFAATSP
jgi:phosphatidylserine/phosphatidylglycerophosphate/cardiolipin synthase-like enzyme